METIKTELITRPMLESDAQSILDIYQEGIATGNATLETKVPAWTDWDKAHIQEPRIVMIENNKVLGWAALSPVSGRCVYGGLGEVSVYVSSGAWGLGIGKKLLDELVRESEKKGFWTLQAGIFPENKASISIHQACGFRIVGTREKIGKMNGMWRDVVLMERRSETIF